MILEVILRHAYFVPAAAVAVGVFSAPVSAAPAPADSAMVQHIKAAVEKQARGDYRGSLKLWESVIADKDFARLTEKDQATIYQKASSNAFDLKQYEVAHSYTVEATHRDGAEALVWRNRFAYEMQEKRFAEAVRTVEEMANRNRGALNTTPQYWFYVLGKEIKSDNQLRRQMMKVLATAYRPDDWLDNADRFKQQYAAILADAGEKAEAWALVHSIVGSQTLIDISLDSRLREALPAGFDGRAEVERDLSAARRNAADHPESLKSLLIIPEYLWKLGRPEEALDLLNAATTSAQGGAKFKDWQLEHGWAWHAIARTYLMLGRFDDAIAAFRRAVQFNGRDGGQTISLGYAQLRFGRPADALATVSLLKPESAKLSAYGWMEMRGLQGCARLALGQAAAAKDDLDYVAAHEQDNPDVLTMLQLCAGDLDGAAAAIIRRLDDPELRPAALRYLSDYDPPPASYPVSPVDTRRGELKARPDVQAAIARAGGVRRFRLQETEI